MEYRSPVTLLMTSIGMDFPASAPIVTPKSIFPAASVIFFPLIFQEMPSPMSSTSVMSSPLILSKISFGTTVVPFMATVTVSPDLALSSCALITFQPFLPLSSLMYGLIESPFSLPLSISGCGFWLPLSVPDCGFWFWLPLSLLLSSDFGFWFSLPLFLPLSSDLILAIGCV